MIEETETADGSEIESIDVVPEDLVKALAAELHGLGSYRFRLTGDGPRKFAECERSPEAREKPGIDIEPVHLIGDDDEIADEITINRHPVDVRTV